MMGFRRRRTSERRHLLLQWQITERCNLRCAHCYLTPTPPAELGWDDYPDVIAQLQELLLALGNGSREPAFGHVTISGGEPFLRKDAEELLGLLAAVRPRLSLALLTNGTFVDDARARRLKRLGLRFVQVSVDGTPATHDRIRGEGNHARTVAAIRRLRRAKIPVLISFTAHRDNYTEFGEVAALGRELGVARVWADRVIPVGRGAECAPLDPYETRDFVERMREARDRERRLWWKPKTQIPLHRALQFHGGGPHYRCTAGSSLLALEPNGDVYPCRRLPIRVGNIRETRLVELYRSNRLLRSLRDEERVPDGCEGCSHKKGCRGGLRCLSWATTGDPWAPDPGCWIASPTR